jgi:hypothetical protein
MIFLQEQREPEGTSLLTESSREERRELAVRKRRYLPPATTQTSKRSTAD